MTEMKKKNLKPLVITLEVREEIKEFKDRLLDMRNRLDETSDFDVKSIDIIFNELDDYDRNMLFAYYSIGECSPTKLAKYLDVTSQCVRYRITKILNKIKQLNDVPKTAHNHYRCGSVD